MYHFEVCVWEVDRCHNWCKGWGGTQIKLSVNTLIFICCCVITAPRRGIVKNIQKLVSIVVVSLHKGGSGAFVLDDNPNEMERALMHGVFRCSGNIV